MSDDVKKVGVRLVVPVSHGAIELRDHYAPATDTVAMDTYVQAERFGPVEHLRRCMESPNRHVRAISCEDYEKLSSRLPEGSSEVYLGAAALRRLMIEQLAPVYFAATQCYGTLSLKFKMGSVELAAEADQIFQLYSKNRRLNKILKDRFHHLARIGFIKSGFESRTWLEKMGLSPGAVRNLSGFAGQPGFIDFRESVTMVLEFLSSLDDYRLVVANKVFEATDSNKWKSVRNTVSTLKALAALDSLPEKVGREFYRSHIDLDGDTRARLRSGVDETLLTFLHEKIGEEGAVGLFFMDEAPKDEAILAHWRNAQAVRRHLAETGLLQLFAQSASFMDEGGRGILKSLIGELAESPVMDGELHYHKRYDRMIDKLGFSLQFVEQWRKEWSKVRDSSVVPMDVAEARALVMGQAAAQLSSHVNSTTGVEGQFSILPDRLRSLIASLGRGEADMEEIAKLHEVLELNYQKIREAYGDLFANSRTDIKNLVAGLKKGVRTAKRSEQTEISGRVDRLAVHGMVPVETCQRLLSLYAEHTNGKGQPLNKILWGQFKIANYRIDGEVMARRLIEATRDEEGLEHLLVERSYTPGGFARLAEFDEDIVEHAREIGIDRDRVHFLDRHEKREVPGPLMTGALIYRDSHLTEVNPAMMKPFQPIPAVSMSMMSARMMLRTGT